MDATTGGSQQPTSPSEKTTTIDEFDPAQRYTAQQYRAEWARRVLQRAGGGAPTAEEVDLLICEFGILEEAMVRFVWRALGTRRGDFSVALAAAVTAYFCGHAHEFRWLQDVADVIRLEEDLYNDLNGGEEQRCYNEEDDV